MGIATAVGGPAGALLTGATAGDEIADITKHFQSGSVSAGPNARRSRWRG